MTWSLQVVGLFGGIAFVVAAVVAVVNRGIREDRIVHLTGLVDELQTGLNNERSASDRKIKEMSDRIAVLEGQVLAVTGEVGERLGRAIADEVIRRIEVRG